jgi:hypothetical protein
MNIAAPTRRIRIAITLVAIALALVAASSLRDGPFILAGTNFIDASGGSITNPLGVPDRGSLLVVLLGVAGLKYRFRCYAAWQLA